MYLGIAPKYRIDLDSYIGELYLLIKGYLTAGSDLTEM